MERGAIYHGAAHILSELADQFPEWKGFLEDIEIRVNPRMRTTAGRAWHVFRRIDLNPHLFWEHPEELRDTVLHEVAHLLAGPRKGHGAEWKRICLKIGARPTRCPDMATAKALYRPQKRHAVRCSACGQTWQVSTRKRNKIRRAPAHGFRHRTCGGMIIA